MDKKIFLGGSGVRLTKQLFIEYDHISDNDNAVYTLSREDKIINGKLYPSLYRLYMEADDITEARFVEQHLYDWEQWERLQSSPVMKEEIELWRKDLKAKLASKLVARLIEDAFNEESRSSTSSAKYLLDNIVKKDNKRSTKGRPSNKNQEDSLNSVSLSLDRQIQKDLERVKELRNPKKNNGTE